MEPESRPPGVPSGAEPPPHPGPDSPVEISTGPGVVTICLRGTEKRNALTPALVEGIRAGLVEAERRSDVRAVVLSHRGSTFCSGLDLREAHEQGMVGGATRLLGLLEAILALPVPVVAQVEGQVRAGGMGLIGACDMVIAGPEARFAFTEARLGLAPAVIALTVLAKMPPAAASLHLLTGRPFDAEQARQLGLVTAVAADPSLALAPILEELRQSSRQGLQETKRLLTATARAAIAAHGQHAVAVSARLFASDEARTNLAAFLAPARR